MGLRGRAPRMLQCTEAEGEATAPAPIGPSIAERRHCVLLPGGLGARVSGTKATASPVSFSPQSAPWTLERPASCSGT